MNTFWLMYALIAVFSAALNFRGIFILIQTGNMTFSGVESRGDWFNIAYPLFVNAVGSACVWPLLLPAAVIQVQNVIKHGLPTVRFKKREPLKMPPPEVLARREERVTAVAVKALNEAFTDDEDMDALSMSYALLTLAWYRMRAEFREQRCAYGEATNYFVNQAAPHIAKTIGEKK